MKFDFNTDDDAAKTTTGADAMTSATGVWLDCVMPINQWSRRLARLRDIERWASARYRNGETAVPRPRATVCSRGRRARGRVASHARRRGGQPSQHFHLSGLGLVAA